MNTKRKATAAVLFILMLTVVSVGVVVAHRNGLYLNYDSGKQKAQAGKENYAHLWWVQYDANMYWKADSPLRSDVMSAIDDWTVAEPHHLPVFDADYDDSWVANVPDEIGGYRVLYIITPKSVACSPEPVILLQAPQESMDEFLSAPPDSNSLSAAIRSIPGAPSHFNLSFGGPIDREAFETRIKERNELAVNRGWCTRFVDPDGRATSE